MHYPIAIEVGDEKHAYSVVVPDLPGCFSAGGTFDEAVTNAREAIDRHLEHLSEHGAPIPTATEIEQHLKGPGHKDWVWATVEIDITPYLGKSHKINVTLPDLLIKRIDTTVSKQGDVYQSRSGFLSHAAQHELERIINKERRMNADQARQQAEAANPNHENILSGMTSEIKIYARMGRRSASRPFSTETFSQEDIDIAVTELESLGYKARSEESPPGFYKVTAEW
ncbi:type II toxin-antitoxin system HicB family antitoxin [Halomonas elongata]|uniref:type II toxin-antitoxin system HicB family antitoxin n=1 Tax=Halomonas elongata TaxID=2746 RepID=UPI00255A9799|nr:type II toxin-antitoxin system HicB family antitoxin [Halomonas elongata]MDL4862784.1 type II toxin-antitoxin system HicB family antitoxin [Halomonas elongata]